MLWQDPFELTHRDNATASTRPEFSIWRRSSEELTASRIGSEPGNGDHAFEPLAPIAWNTHGGLYDSPDAVDRNTRSVGTFTQSVIAFTAIWSLCELPLEVLSSRTPVESMACIAAKLIWLALTLWALSERRVAKAVFALCCGVSAFYIAMGLAAERQFLVAGFYLSTVECVLKVAACALIAWPLLRRVIR
jgi:hypothetical protein